MNQKICQEIAERFEEFQETFIPLAYRLNYTRLSFMMDLELVAKMYPDFRWSDLLRSDKNDFWHDTIGIRNNLDRENKCMMNCFHPRFAGKTLEEQQRADNASSARVLVDIARSLLRNHARMVCTLINDLYDANISEKDLGVMD